MNNYLVVNSLSRNSTLSSSSSSCTFILNNKIRLNGRKRLYLEYFICYNTVFTINSTNNKIDFFENALNKLATLISGFYDANSLATEIKTQLDTTSGGFNTYTVTYSTITKKYTVSAGNNFRLLFSTGSAASTSPWKQLGFTTTGLTGIDTVLGTSTTANDVVNLSLPLSYYIQIDTFGLHNFKTTDGDTYTYYIPATASNGSIVEYSSGRYFKQYIDIPSNLNVIDRIDLSIRGRNGSSLSLNGSEFELVLSIK